MATIFKYNNKLYQAINLDKKLKRLRISKNDIEIILETNQEELEKKFVELSNEKNEEIEPEVKLYYFINKETGYSVTTINPNYNREGYEQTTKETLEKLFSKRKE